VEEASTRILVECLCGHSVGLRFGYENCYILSVHNGGTGSGFKAILYMSAVPVALLNAATFATLHCDFLAKRSHLFKAVQRSEFTDPPKNVTVHGGLNRMKN
jgi:hypothetical protein